MERPNKAAEANVMVNRVLSLGRRGVEHAAIVCHLSPPLLIPTRLLARFSLFPLPPLPPNSHKTFNARKHSLGMPRACSAMEFSRPPAQLAGSLPVSRPSQKAPSALPTCKDPLATPHSSQAYDSALTSPPDGRLHTILRIASTGIRIKGEKYVHHVPRDIQSTL